MSNQRPRSVVEFSNKDNLKSGLIIDESKICDACKYNETKLQIDWQKEKIN